MTSDYNLYSAFDVEKHKATYVNYLEVLIGEDGTVMYAVPSHQSKAMALACERLGVTRNQLDALCPHEYYCDYMRWLCMVAGVVAVWNDHCIAVEPTTKQIAALRKLKLAGIYKGAIPHSERRTEDGELAETVSRLQKHSLMDCESASPAVDFHEILHRVRCLPLVRRDEDWQAQSDKSVE